MKFSASLRTLGLLRRIAVALEEIAEQLKFGNERAFPPLKDAGPGKHKIVISRGKPDAAQE